jgi:hypothetical protein
MQTKQITRNQTGHRCGRSHPKAKLTTDQVVEIRKLYEGGGFGYEVLALAFSCGISTVRDIVKYRTRWNG